MEASALGPRQRARWSRQRLTGLSARLDGAAVAASWRALWSTRILVLAAGVSAVLTERRAAGSAGFDPASLTSHLGRLGDVLVAPAARWDSVWYLTIARHGYGGPGLGSPATRSAFFPLYPLLNRLAALPGEGLLIAGVLVSLGAMAVALYLLFRLGELELGAGRPGGHPDAPRLAVWALAASPMALFLSALYSESLYLALCLGAFWAARHGRWAAAGALGALAAATRNTGVLLLLPLVLLYLRGPREDRPPGAVGLDLLWLGLIPLGLAAFPAYLASRGLDPMTPFHAEHAWYRHFAGPLGGVRDGAVAAFDGARQLLSGSRAPVYFPTAGGDPMTVARANLWQFAALVALVPMMVGVLRRLPAAYGVYVLGALAVSLSYPVTPQPLISLSRYAMALFPLALWLGWWLAEHPRARIPVLGLSVVGLAFATARFATWHFVA